MLSKATAQEQTEQSTKSAQEVAARFDRSEASSATSFEGARAHANSVAERVGAENDAKLRRIERALSEQNNQSVLDVL